MACHLKYQLNFLRKNWILPCKSCRNLEEYATYNLRTRNMHLQTKELKEKLSKN